MKKRTICRAVFTTLTVLLLAFIFGNSSADGEQSTEFSLIVTQWLNGVLESMNIPIVLPHLLVRKLAHFSEYSVLGILLTATVCSWRKRAWRFGTVWLPIVCGLCVASADEYLQTFVPERSGNAYDVLIDFSGVLWAAIAASAVIVLKIRKKQSKSAGITKRKNNGI